MFFADRLTLDKPRRTADGFLVTRARAARTGFYEYSGAEIDPQNEHGLRDLAVVNVLRDEEAVFDKKSLHSFVGKPITNNHPHEAVTAKNWRDHARGVVMGAVRDGEYVAFDLLLTDAAAIRDVEAGKQELSNGYGAELEFGNFTADDGTACPVRQKSIAGNHVAIVDRGRAGADCRIGDAATCDAASVDVLRLLLDHMIADGQTYSGGSDHNKNKPTNAARQSGDLQMHTLIIDGLQVTEVSDQAKAAIEKLQTQLKDERDGRAADKTGHDKTLATKDAEIDDLKTKTVDQAKIDQLADAKAAVVADAKVIAGDKLGDTAGKSVSEVRRMACVAVLGDAALKDKSDEYVEARFDTLKDGKPAQRDPVRDAISSGVRSNVTDHGAGVRDLARAAQY